MPTGQTNNLHARGIAVAGAQRPQVENAGSLAAISSPLLGNVRQASARRAFAITLYLHRAIGAAKVLAARNAVDAGGARDLSKIQGPSRAKENAYNSLIPRSNLNRVFFKMRSRNRPGIQGLFISLPRQLLALCFLIGLAGSAWALSKEAAIEGCRMKVAQ